ncbi:Vacuolar protein sorting-associated protein 16 [Lodderomyces elongisporus]|uniref:Vacuolar protein sorting-associated protein 16 n=1 Tax=Lodderomyces elongisporus TaxID=36914 RepID=UPI002925F59E|nr:Vacuolar protein sorting-associated protein 16 [Lodderomyces elongisporus]WLF78079.1 Vacuolar protein sorting-associated protein 16 [Lodderomyces elongisporus]
MITNPSFNWSRLQNVFYDLKTCYNTLPWSINSLYTNYRLSISENATLIAVATKSTKFINLIEVYSGSGNKLWSIVYNSNANDYIHGFYFKEEDLIVVFSNGIYRHYQDFAGNFNEFSLNESSVVFDNLSQNRASNGDLNLETTTDSVRRITDLQNGQSEEINNIVDAEIYGSFLVTRYESKFVITDLESHKNYRLDFAKYNVGDIYGMALHGSNQDPKTLNIYISYMSTIIVCNVDFGLSKFEMENQELTDGPFNEISVSSNGKLIALLNRAQSKVFVVNYMFDNMLLEYDTSKELSKPFQVEWCGNDAIVLSLRDEIKVLGPGQQLVSFYYDIEEETGLDFNNYLSRDTNREGYSYVVPILQSAADGLRVLTGDKIQFLTRVPNKTINMYQIGSTSPSATLADCVDKFNRDASKANANITLLKSEGLLTTALSDCLYVALDEFDIELQKRALRAVSFGKIYDEENYDADEYLTTINIIKVLNQLRSPEIGLCLSFAEVQIVGWKNIIKMLLRRNQHYLAVKVIESLQLDNLRSLVYIHWCCYKIRKELDMSDVKLYQTIVDKLISAPTPFLASVPSLATKNTTNHLPVGDICDVAHEEGRIILCKLINNLEPSISKKIKKLIDINEVELALIKAFQSGSYDLSRLVLARLQTTLTISDFFKVLNQNESKLDEGISNELREANVKISNEPFHVRGEVVGHTWLDSLATLDTAMKERFMEHQDKYYSLYLSKLKLFKEAHPDPEGEEYYTQYKSLLKSFLQGTSHGFTQKAIQKELNILELQKRLETTYLSNFYQETSVINILGRMVKMHQVKPAQKIAKEFSVSQEKFWYLVLRIYSESRQFDRLYEFALGSLDSVNGKSPIGFEPFVDAGFSKHAPKEHISVYIKNSLKYNYNEKINLFIKNEDFASAAQEALKNKDIDLLRNLQKSAPSSNSTAIRVINNSIQKLGYQV